MKRIVAEAVLKLIAKAVLISLVAGIVVVIMGYTGKWTTSIEYSNGFFIAGSLLIIAGASSKVASGQDWDVFQRVYAESFREMSVGDRASFIVEASNSVSLLILGVMSGILLIIAAVVVPNTF